MNSLLTGCLDSCSFGLRKTQKIYRSLLILTAARRRRALTWGHDCRSEWCNGGWWDDVIDDVVVSRDTSAASGPEFLSACLSLSRTRLWH